MSILDGVRLVPAFTDDGVSAYRLEGGNFLNRYYVVTEEGTRRLLNSPEVVSFDVYRCLLKSTGRMVRHFAHKEMMTSANILSILRGALKTLVENLNYLTGHGADSEELNELRREIEAVPGVIGVHQLFAEYVGTKLRLDVHIDLDPDMPLHTVHDIETEIERRMAQRKEIDHIFIHVEPYRE